MKKTNLIIFILILFISNKSSSQFIRGAIENEIYINIDYYWDTCSHYALFYSGDNGHTLQTKYEYNYLPQGNPSLGEIISDVLPGVLYNIPVAQSDFMISYDYGASWELREVIPANGRFFCGSVPGEIFHCSFSSQGYLMRSADYAQNFDTINNNVKYIFCIKKIRNI